MVNISIDNRDGRVVLASMGQLWAFFTAMGASEWAVASSVLTYFQRAWVDVRPVAMRALPEAQRRSWESAVPRTLAADGIWGDQTNRAARVLLLLTFGSESYNVFAASVPTTAARIGSWFTGTLEPYDTTLPADVLEILDSFVEEALNDQPQFVAENMAGHTAEVVEGVAIDTPRVIPRDPATMVNTSDPGRDAATVVHADDEDDAVDLPEPGGAAVTTALDDMLIRGGRANPVWTYALWALGAVTFGGLAWWAWGYRQRRRGAA